MLLTTETIIAITVLLKTIVCDDHGDGSSPNSSNGTSKVIAVVILIIILTITYIALLKYWVLF